MQCLSLLTIFQGFHLKVKVSPTDDIEMLLYVIKGYKTAFKHGSFQVVEGPPLNSNSTVMSDCSKRRLF